VIFGVLNDYSVGVKQMIIYPAMDIRGGKVVRLVMGDYQRETIYSDDPMATAEGFAAKGAGHLHIVDLDGAKDGVMTNFGSISELLSGPGLFTQIGGGIRNMDRLNRYIQAGASRVIIGTAAVKDPDFLEQALAAYPGQVAVGVDARDGKVATDGWLSISELSGFDFCRRLYDQGVETIIYTDISRDGMMSGPNFQAYEQLSEITGLKIIASGGVSNLEDIKKLADTGVHGAIIGKALYTGAIDLKEALIISEAKK
jgi:phosphoribosylformimino-5-aminoimidazole carboxamide ribotide isomerase